MKAIQMATILSLALLAGGASAATIAGPLTYPATGHTYYLLAAKGWTASEAEALTLGGHLVTLNDLAENDWVFDSFAPIVRALQPSGDFQPSLWIGLSDAAVDGIFTWVNGEAVSFTHWDVGQPNNSGGDQDYVFMRGVGPLVVGQPRFGTIIWTTLVLPKANSASSRLSRSRPHSRSLLSAHFR